MLSQGTFVNDVHTVKGTVKLYEKAGQHTVVFENFSTDGGPDLRLYLSDGVAVFNFVEVSRLAASGSFFRPAPASFDPTKHRTVLIWYRRFSVLFGHADLKQIPLKHYPCENFRNPDKVPAACAGTGPPETASLAGSVETTTLNTGLGLRDSHLRKAEYFDVATFPALSSNR